MWKTLRIGALDINGNSHDAMMMMMMKDYRHTLALEE